MLRYMTLFLMMRFFGVKIYHNAIIMPQKKKVAVKKTANNRIKDFKGFIP